jgi:hypothetical protein
MSRRSVVINRWKRAFMMVVAANFFKSIALGRRPSQSISQSHLVGDDEKYEKLSPR